MTEDVCYCSSPLPSRVRALPLMGESPKLAPNPLDGQSDMTVNLDPVFNQFKMSCLIAC
ncbi:hypothetical protein DPMN_105441 [Dreissena polymorpha]|uniref:Uncharacterized protein n=1 Tax=Dreissena polymorpha TaxID=45954 RepID=A0A9D4H9J7_DREPO|nr:hypothetical protein DPMN_105441 [Dreissena polymorpha]